MTVAAARSRRPPRRSRCAADLFGGIRGEVKAVTDVSFKLAKGDVFGLAGESGSGKSTIARMILGLTDPSEGAILLDGRDLRIGSHARRPAARPSRWCFKIPVPRSIRADRSASRSRSRLRRARSRGRMSSVASRVSLDMVQLPADFRNRYPHELSGRPEAARRDRARARGRAAVDRA